MVGFVFDGPVASYGVQSVFGTDRLVGKLVSGLSGSFPKARCRLEAEGGPLHPDDSRDVLFPLGSANGACRIEHVRHSGFMAVASVLIAGLRTR